MSDTKSKSKVKKRGYDLKSRPENKQRRREHVQEEQWISDFIKRAPLGYFATRWDDQPFVHPMTYWYDEDKHCLYMHGAIMGRRDANTKRHEKIAFCASEMGQMLPSNRALNFSTQFRSVMAYGEVVEVTTDEEKKHAFYGLIEKYFSPMELDKDFSPIIQEDLDRTRAYRIEITSWSGKENWSGEATQSPDFPPLADKWLKEDSFPNSYGKMK
ncbi:MAG: pyridoxamine 5'-phosphate oxidase family protein [Kordiimonadaceae bacterium]|nr:pyridoxamine 5'-phosphate oxidase family protein [Kordiimonadaceae bacterium]MBT6035156.1 pyridoxamine 5'-phosphate oxidase family protein [Kordiimonadaceae bacterium]MBT6329830.1 pyridoxamine 5'-phosphate oxidase family protein [Kordiimonadaceae bacterium]MBT7581852.1 pyridoxamine 5'-phosphate oxidase family protein [Kordiimonadaceae bacterium]